MGSMRTIRSQSKKKPIITKDEDGTEYIDIKRLKQSKAKPLGLGSSGEPILFPVPVQTRVNTVSRYDSKNVKEWESYEAEIVVGLGRGFTVGSDCQTKKEAAIKALEASVVFFQKAIEAAEADLTILREDV